MPTFEPAAPVAPGIQSDYGATEQWNKTFPALAGLYEAAGRNANQAAGETARNQTQTNISSGELDARQRMQYVQDRAAQDQQERQFQQQSDLQNQAAFNEAALSGIKVSQVEQAHMQRQQNAVNSILQMTNDGTLDMSDPEVRQQVNDAIFEAKTGINQTQRRMQQQQAADMAAQGKLRDAETARITKAQAQADKFESEWTAQGGKFYTDDNGKRHAIMWNPKSKQWYSPITPGGRKEDGSDPISDFDTSNPEFSEIKPFIDKQGNLDYGKARKDAETYAKDLIQPRMVKNDSGTGQHDEAEADRRAWIAERMKGLQRIYRESKGTNSPNATQANPTTPPDQGGQPTDPSQQAQAANDQRGDQPVVAVKPVEELNQKRFRT